MLGYLGLAIVGELGSSSGKLHWFLLLIFVCLHFAIWLSLVLTDLGGLDCSRPPVRQAVLSLVRAVLLCSWIEQASYFPVFLVRSDLLGDR